MIISINIIVSIMVPFVINNISSINIINIIIIIISMISVISIIMHNSIIVIIGYVYIYIYIHIYTYTYTYTHIHVCVPPVEGHVLLLLVVGALARLAEAHRNPV